MQESSYHMNRFTRVFLHLSVGLSVFLSLSSSFFSPPPPISPPQDSPLAGHVGEGSVLVRLGDCPVHTEGDWAGCLLALLPPNRPPSLCVPSLWVASGWYSPYRLPPLLLNNQTTIDLPLHCTLQLIAIRWIVVIQSWPVKLSLSALKWSRQR